VTDELSGSIFSANTIAGIPVIEATSAYEVKLDPNNNGRVQIGQGSDARLVINQGSDDGNLISFKSSDVAHGVTDVAETDTYGFIKKFSAAEGGIEMFGISEGERPLVFKGIGNTFETIGSGTGTDKVICQIQGFQSSGTGTTNMTANGVVFAVRAQKGGSMQTVFMVDEDGDIGTDGSTSLTGYDYAEYFEWLDGNPDDEDRVGYCVVLEGDKIRKAQDGDIPIGVVSATPAVIGDNPMSWTNAWKTDKWGRKINKEVEWVKWDNEQWRVDDLTDDIEVPDDAEYFTQYESQHSDDYDESKEYISRGNRKEWSAIGMMGKLRIRKGQPTAPSWIKMKDEGDDVEMWLVK